MKKKETESQVEKKVKYTCPANTHKRCRAFMGQVLSKLNASEAVETVDLGALDLLCGSYNLYCQSDDQIRQDGVTVVNRLGEVKSHPAVNVRHQAFNQCVAVMKELGLTIKSRSRLSVIYEENESDPLSDFL